MSKQYYLRNKIFHGFPKLSSKAKVTQVENGQSVSILFIVAIIITIQDHMIEIYPMVSEIHGNVDLVLRVKSFVELEGEINMREQSFKFLKRAVPIFPVHKEMITSKEKGM